MSVPNTDYDAAQALLDLQGTIKQENSGPYLWQSFDNKQGVDKTARKIWNSFISTEVQALPTLNRQLSKIQTGTKVELPKVLKPIEVYSHNKPKMIPKTDVPFYRSFDSIANQSQKVPTENRNREINFTNEVATQTEERYCHPNIEFMENTITKLYERIQSLENKLKRPEVADQYSDYVGSENDDLDNQSYVSRYSIDESMSRNDKSKFGQYRNYSNEMRFEDPDDIRLSNEQNKSRTSHKIISNNANSYTKSSALVPIGDGNVSLPARLLKNINWNSYTSATRKLLTAVFSRRILATHSLTGRPSPAFPNKPAKKKLDPALVNDIVQTVVERCAVPENVVRTSITTKCADESKMFKTRKSNNKKKRTSKRNCENIPPTTSESDSEDY